MKVAIVHDELMRRGGAEQVVLTMLKAFPEADIYTLAYNPEGTYPEFKKYKVFTSSFQIISKSVIWMQRLYFPFALIAMHRMKVTGYDIVLASTTHCAKYVKVDDNATVITYCHTPFRLAWRPESYREVKDSGLFKKLLYRLVINILRKVDAKSALRTDWFLTNANEVVPRIQSAYNPKRGITVINPPVKCKNFIIADKIKDYYLVVSRFEPYKKVDLVIEAFNMMPEKKLIIVGKGSMEPELLKMAKSNTTFLSGLSADQIGKLYAECKALIFPQHEDYGITPLEANASGRPVIAYGQGGVTETMIPYKTDASKATAVFFEEQTIQSLTDAMKLFEVLDFDPHFIRQHAEKFDELVFVKQLQKFVNSKIPNTIKLEIVDDFDKKRIGILENMQPPLNQIPKKVHL